MINRKRLKCVSCGTRTITRTGIGHGIVQKHKFACPGCGVEIGYVLNLDQTAVSIDYEAPSNAEWDEGEDPGDNEILFYPELMVPKHLPYGLSPFVATFGNHKDIQEYQKIEAARRHFKEKFWPALERAYIHLESGNVDLLKKDCEEMVQSFPDLSEQEDRGAWLMAVTRHFFDFFVVEPELKESIDKSVAYAYHYHENELRKLAAEYVRSGRMAALWKEVKSVRRQFMELYESFLPLVMVRRYWRKEYQDISGYELSVKNFEDLKGFYIDCVETAFRLMTIGLAIELIATTGRPVLKTKSGDKTIWWFEQINNGIKDGHLNKHAIFAPVLSALDLGLRNGVGHHAAHYDVQSDEIVYVKADDANLSESRLPFTEFVDKSFKAYCAFELAAEWFRWLFVAGGGRFR